MVDDSGKGLIFVVSPPRAGSTLLAAMLGSHTQLFAPPEPWILLALHAALNRGTFSVSPSDSAMAIFAATRFLDDDQLLVACRAFATAAYNQKLVSTGKDMFVDKTPRYYHLDAFIQRLYPASRRIILVRSPLDMIASAKSAWNKAVGELMGDSLTPFSFDYTLGIEKIGDMIADPNDYQLVVRYENLVTNPHQVLSGICHWLGLPLQSAMISYGTNTDLVQIYRQSRLGDSGIGTHSRPVGSSIGRWHHALTHQEIRRVLCTLGSDQFSALGYQSEYKEADGLVGDDLDIAESVSLEEIQSAYDSYVTDPISSLITMSGIITPPENQEDLLLEASASFPSLVRALENRWAEVNKALRVLQEEINRKEAGLQYLEKELAAKVAALSKLELETELRVNRLTEELARKDEGIEYLKAEVEAQNKTIAVLRSDAEG